MDKQEITYYLVIKPYRVKKITDIILFTVPTIYYSTPINHYNDFLTGCDVKVYNIIILFTIMLTNFSDQKDR